MKEVWIALIISCVALGVSVASMLLPVKAWLRYWFPRLWPPSGQNDARRPADLESGGGGRTDASGGINPAPPDPLDQRDDQLQDPPDLVGRDETPGPSAPSNSGGGRADPSASEGSLTRTD
ncbi:hypothetical protein Aspvir_009936 [Aspergillus viridinutans]|uniref:Uncharacterized protein n=1 Tax=Aspergillus viridinutans TaxID=75553 RepID=A0A9P3C4Q0_ASPVI|nr:uncharacterized protein Aspvir_009936 [Aspergillus viridinutans]GIK05822.1 hypothetical protein Aspvir_009936 [Aspergillus viridinutans]